MNFISGFLKGMALGIGAIAPGVSGGALAVIFGIYERITDAIAHVFTNLKKNIVFFFPIGLGGVFGVLAFSRIINYLFENYVVEVKYLFIGLMIGTLPSVVKQANKKGFKIKYISSLIAALGITILFSILEKGAISAFTESSLGVVRLIIYGGIIGFGTIVPGISASFILMYIGGYQTVLNSIANIDIAIITPIGIGFVLSIILFAKLISLLFKKAYGYTYYAVLGFVIGSVIPIFPGIAFNLKYLICVLLFAIGFYLASYLSQYE